MTAKTLLITGASGFMASHLLDLVWHDQVNYRVKAFQGDITSRKDVVRNLRDVDTVINFAALTYLPPSWYSPEAYARVNYEGVLNFMQNHEMFLRFVQISTSHVYGNQPKLPIEITMPPLPDDPYSIAKFAAEQAVKVYSEKFGFKSLIVRPFNNFGPRQSRHFVVPSFCIQAIEKGKIVVKGNTQRELIYVKDTARILKALLDKGSTGLLQIAKGVAYSMFDLAKMVLTAAGKDPDASMVDLVPTERPFDIQTLLGSSKSLSDQLGTDFRGFMSMEQALKETVAWYRYGEYPSKTDETHI